MTTDLRLRASGRVLDPIDHVSEVLFGRFMVLTFTGTQRGGQRTRRGARHAGGGDRLQPCLGLRRWRDVRAAQRRRTRTQGPAGARGARRGRPEQAHGLIGDEIGGLSRALAAADLERLRQWRLRQWIVAQPAHAGQAVGVTRLDLRGAVAVFLLVFASTFPVVLPFFFIADPGVAKRVSAAVAITMLFLCGFARGRYAGLRAWRAGLVMVLPGLGVEAVVIALGG